MASTTIADFDEDGVLDLAVASNAGIQILLGNGAGGIGDGTFAAAVHYGSGSTGALATADLDDDGILDIVATTGGGVSVFLGQGSGGDGDGTFAAPVGYTAAGAGHVAIADLDGDTVLDLAVAQVSADSVGILLGDGDGTFGAVASYAAGAGAGHVAIGDFDEDSNPDLAVTVPGEFMSWDNKVAILLGDGDGTFGAAVEYVAAESDYTSPHAIAISDFDEDGILDLAVATSGGLGVLRGNGSGGTGDGTFGGVESYVSTYSTWISALDADGDGITDLAMGPELSFRLGDGSGGTGDGTFGSLLTFDLPVGNSNVALGDFDEDGLLDAASGYSVREFVTLAVECED
jgi:hypothetical protein